MLIPSNEASVAGWNTCSGERVTTISPNLSGFSFAGHQHHRAAYLFVPSARLCTATSRQPADSGFPQPGIEKIFHVLPAIQAG